MVVVELRTTNRFNEQCRSGKSEEEKISRRFITIKTKAAVLMT
jgi:hypothetical protein